MPVVNIRSTNLSSVPQEKWPASHVYIGRPGKGMRSIFGNPVKAGEPCPVCGLVHREPGDTLPCYRKWLAEKIASDPAFRAVVASLRRKTLVCFCAPKPCHGDILLEFADNIIDEQNEKI